MFAGRNIQLPIKDGEKTQSCKVFIEKSKELENKQFFFLFPLHENSFVIQDERRCAPASPLIIPNGHFESMKNTAKKTMDGIIVVKAGCINDKT